MRNTAYMCKNKHGTYYARFIIPNALQSHFKNKKEIRRSLQTDSKKLAVQRARVYRVAFESIVNQLMSKKNDSKISERAKLLLDELLVDKTARQEAATAQFFDGFYFNNEPAPDDNELRLYLITYMGSNGKKVEIDYNGDVKKEVEAYNLMQSEEERTVNEKRAEEIHQAQLAAIKAQTPIEAPLKQANKASRTVSEYLNEYIAHKMTQGKKGSWSAGTARQKGGKSKVGGDKKNAKFTAFIEVFGDKPAAHLTRDDMNSYIDIASKIPKNFYHQNFREFTFKGITLDMVINNTQEVRTLNFTVRDTGTIRDDLKIIKAFLNWVSKHRDVDLQTPINALSNEISDIDYESQKRAFTNEELKILFEDDNAAPQNYVKGFSEPVCHWPPLIALYSGARLGEICQLHLEDIKEVKALSTTNSHWCIDINDDDEKTLKNKYSKRQIPIHENLINAGFLDYVDGLRSKGETRLFPKSPKTTSHFTTVASKFATYSDQATITDKNTSFHSFRHCFCSILSANHVPEDLVIALSGHQYKSLAKSTYDRSQKRDVGKLAEVINSIDYGLKHSTPFN